MTDLHQPCDPELHAYLDALLTPAPAEGEAPAPETPAPAEPPAPEPAAEPPPDPVPPPGCPDWLGARFAVLIFRLGPLRFAAPVAQLRGAWEIDDGALHPVSGPALLGEVELLGDDWMLLDTAALIVPGRTVTTDYRWALPTELGTFALACEGVERETEVAAHQVQWRAARHSRPWLLGMLTGAAKCPLLDIETLVTDWQARLQK